MSQETTRDMSNNKLKIRIQIQQPPQAIEEIYPEPEVTYEQTLDWNKIVIAALLSLSILGLLGYLLFTGGDDEKPASEMVSADNSTASNPGNTPLSEKTEPQLGTANGTTGTQSSELINAQKIPAGPAESKATGNAGKPIPVPVKKPQLTTTKSQSDSTGKKIPKTAVQAKPEKTSDHVEVVRAQLSHAIDAREPVDSIDAVQLRPGESKPIYFYLHLKNLQGKNIRIDWYYNNKLDSKLNLRVHNNNWRTHASKQLDQRRLGAWRVELIDESGNRLATRDFTVTQQ